MDIKPLMSKVKPGYSTNTDPIVNPIIAKKVCA